MATPVRSALEYFERSLAADPSSEYADAARRASAQLRAHAPRVRTAASAATR